MSIQDPTIRTSQVGAAVKALYLLLVDAGLPAHPATGEIPQVFLGYDPLDQVAEYATVVTNPDETFNAWARMGAAGRDEEFTVDIVVRSSTPAEYDQVAAWDRITGLVDAVQAPLYDTATGKPAEIGFPNERKTGRAAAVDQAILPTGDGGFIGSGVVRVALSARI